MSPRTSAAAHARQLAAFSRHPVAQNAAALFALQAARYLVPLVLIPFLARVLLPEAFGRLAFAQSLAATLALLAEYGFSYSATREVARQLEDPAGLRDVAAGVLGAKVLLASVAVGAGAVLLLTVPLFAAHPEFLWGACILAIAQASSPAWFFQGVESMGLECAVELSGTAAAAIAVLILVREPARAAWPLYLTGFGVLAASLINHCRMYRRIPCAWPQLRLIALALSKGIALFFERGSVAFLTTANVFLLGLFVPATAVADFAGAEKVIRACSAGLGPVNQAVFPRMSRLMARDRDRAFHWAPRIFAGYAIFAGLCALIIWAAAPWIIRLGMGPGYSAAVPLLRLLSVVLLFIPVTQVLLLQVMLPLGMDWAVNAIVLAGAATNIAMILLLVPSHGDQAMVWAILGSEVVMSASIIVVLWRSRVFARILKKRPSGGGAQGSAILP